jgi:hypothetical protein
MIAHWVDFYRLFAAGLGGEQACQAQADFQARDERAIARARTVDRKKMFGVTDETILDNPDKAIMDLAGITGHSNVVRASDAAEIRAAQHG